MVIGDLNAKVGSDNLDHHRAMGMKGCGIMNNGQATSASEFCTTYDLVIGGTLFLHQEIHKHTWCSPNGRRPTGHVEDGCRMSESEEGLMSAVSTILSRQPLN